MTLWDTRLRKSECIMTQYSKKTTEYIENIVREVTNHTNYSVLALRMEEMS